jgi:predicted nucleic acid-binding protein
LKWAPSHPAWLQVRQVQTAHEDAALWQLDPGERAAIILAQQEADALLLIDDAAGRTEAARRGIPSTGTLGILRAAAVRQLLDLPIALRSLAATNFRVSESLIAELFAEDCERKRREAE